MPEWKKFVWQAKTFLDVRLSVWDGTIECSFLDPKEGDCLDVAIRKRRLVERLLSMSNASKVCFELQNILGSEGLHGEYSDPIFVCRRCNLDQDGGDFVAKKFEDVMTHIDLHNSRHDFHGVQLDKLVSIQKHTKKFLENGRVHKSGTSGVRTEPKPDERK